MFAVVRTGGKQYRVAPGDKIVVEKLDGNAGDRITLGDVLLAGEGSDLKSTDGLTVAAEIVAQAKADKVTVFKKRRRHNYRRKKGHRQQHTILKIVAIGDQKEPEEGRARRPRQLRPKPAASLRKPQVKGRPDTPRTAPARPPARRPRTRRRPARRQPALPRRRPRRPLPPKPKAESGSTKNAAPAKAAAKKLTESEVIRHGT